MNADEVNKIGSLLETFAKLEYQRLYWSPKEAAIDNLLKFRDRRVGDNIEAAFSSLPEYQF